MLCVLSFLGESRRVPLESEVRPHDSKYSSWVKRTRAPSFQEFDLTVQLRVDQANLDKLERVFWQVSDPQHENYGKHRTPEQVGQILAVPAERVAIVREFFLSHHASQVQLAPHGDVLKVTMTVENIEEALQTQLFSFSHSEWTSVNIIRAGVGYSLPSEVAREVVIVGELLQFPRLRSKQLYNIESEGAAWPNDCSTPKCAGKVTPGVLATRYKLPKDAAAVPKNSMAVAEFQNQYFKETDLKLFSTDCHVDAKVDIVIGGNKDTAGVEAELDIEYIKAVSPEIPLTVIYSAQYSLLNWCNKIVSNASSPYVHSVSYGNDEAQQTGRAYMLSCNTAFQKAGAQGLSILFASGDQGVWGREGTRGKKFHPDFPASSPYITGVGGTNFATKGTIGDETTWNAGGGGFSDTFPIPEWQAKVVAAYKADPAAKLPPQSYWNNTGRGYPDVAALGGQTNPYCIASRGTFLGVAGTSASSPVVAGVFAKLNGLRLAAGKPVLGHLNPFIYQNPSGFQDVTSGKNDQGHEYGFTAIKGWDPATGFGTPDYAALSKLV